MGGSCNWRVFITKSAMALDVVQRQLGQRRRNIGIGGNGDNVRALGEERRLAVFRR
jgi:hypothetical protein